MINFKMTSYTCSYNDEEDGNLFYDIYIESVDNVYKFHILDDVLYKVYIKDYSNIETTSLIGPMYDDYDLSFKDIINEEANIQTFIKNIKDRKFPCNYIPTKTNYYSGCDMNPHASILTIDITDEKTTINSSIIPTNKELLDSIVRFFDKMFISKDNYIINYIKQ
jgi:hypothetical protein